MNCKGKGGGSLVGQGKSDVIYICMKKKRSFQIFFFLLFLKIIIVVPGKVERTRRRVFLTSIRRYGWRERLLAPAARGCWTQRVHYRVVMTPLERWPRPNPKLGGVAWFFSSYGTGDSKFKLQSGPLFPTHEIFHFFNPPNR